MQLHTVFRKQVKTRLAIMGKAGTGKTYSSLLVAYGITGDWSKIALIDTEEESASLYSHLGAFTTVQIGAPYHPSRYYEALELCEEAGKQVIIIDSLSPEWTGQGGVVDRLDKHFYEDALREHRALLNRIGSSEAHVICTLRSRQKLVRLDDDGRKCLRMVERPEQQEGLDYRFNTMLRLDSGHRAHVVKDRTGVFTGKQPAQLEPDHGAFLCNWCSQGMPMISEDLQQRINACRSVQELHQLVASESLDVTQIAAFTRRRIELEGSSHASALAAVQGGLL